jgi:peroxiredoxin
MQKLTTSDLKGIKSYPQSDLDEDTKNRENLKGSTVEALSLTDMNGTVHTLQSLKGKVIVLDFWYVKCGSCITEMPELNKIRGEYGTDNVAWFGITYDTKRKVEKFLQKTKFDFNLVPDSKKITDFFNIKYYPATFVLNTNGQIVYTGKNGAIAGRSKELRAILDEILGDKKPGLVNTSTEIKD